MRREGVLYPEEALPGGTRALVRKTENTNISTPEHFLIPTRCFPWLKTFTGRILDIFSVETKVRCLEGKRDLERMYEMYCGDEKMELFEEIYSCYYQVGRQILRESERHPVTVKEMDGIIRNMVSKKASHDSSKSDRRGMGFHEKKGRTARILRLFLSAEAAAYRLRRDG